MATPTEIGAYEAKTRLPEFLRKVKAGNSFVITQRGKPVADLLPAQQANRHEAAAAAARMRAFMLARGETTDVDIKALIEEGRD